MAGDQFIDAYRDVTKLSDVDLVVYRSELERAAERIENDLCFPRESVDRGWEARAESARRIFRRATQRCQEEQGRRRRAGDQAYERAFVRIAFRDLEEQDFTEMSVEAREVALGRMPMPAAVPAGVGG